MSEKVLREVFTESEMYIADAWKNINSLTIDEANTLAKLFYGFDRDTYDIPPEELKGTFSKSDPECDALFDIFFTGNISTDLIKVGYDSGEFYFHITDRSVKLLQELEDMLKGN